MNIKYLLGSLVTIPILPILYFQGKKIKASVPRLPEATGPIGSVDAESKKELKLITIGESTIAGVGVETHEVGFSGTLAKSLSDMMDKRIDWRVYAKSGYNVRKVTNQIIPLIEENEVDLIVIGMGGNDAFELNSPQSWRKDIEKMIAALRAKFSETPIVFTHMPPIKDFPAFTPAIKFVMGNLVELFAEELDKVALAYPNVYFPTERIVLSHWIDLLENRYTAEDFFSDGVHPSELTYQTWANEMAKFIFDNVTDIRN